MAQTVGELRVRVVGAGGSRLGRWLLGKLARALGISLRVEEVQGSTKAASKGFVAQLLAAGIPIVGKLAEMLGVSGREIMDRLESGEIYERDVARAIGQYVKEVAAGRESVQGQGSQA